MWDAGRQLAEKALPLAGPAAPRWWWPIAKGYYKKGPYDLALEYFRRSYVEDNWPDHPHLAYTMPYLDRTDEARSQVAILLKLKPDVSVDYADRAYKMWCFDADYRDRMVKALRLVGLREYALEARK